MADVQDLFNIYQSFCQFGSSRNLATPAASHDSLTGPTMDGAKFAKFARDTKLLDKNVTAIDIDIFFKKVKKSDARKLDFESFREALKLVADKKFPTLSPSQAYVALVKHVTTKSGPKSSGTVPTNTSDIVSRLTDTSKYTGTHKHRFDEQGKGRGILGRDRPNPTADLSQITNREAATVTGVPISAALHTGSIKNLSQLPSSPAGKKRVHDLVKSKDSLVGLKRH